MNCLYIMALLTVTCSISPPARFPLQSAASTTRRDSPVIGMRSITPLAPLAQWTGKASSVNRDIWGVYEEVRVPFTSPTWNFWGFYSFEVDFAEREEWYSTNTSAVLPSGLFPAVPAQHSKYNAQKPKVSIRWQPMDPKYIGALTLRGSYTEAFHAPTLSEVTPASSQNFPIVADPFSTSDRATDRGASHW